LAYLGVLRPILLWSCPISRKRTIKRRRRETETIYFVKASGSPALPGRQDRLWAAIGRQQKMRLWFCGHAG
jgi:hypothetical protein